MADNPFAQFADQPAANPFDKFKKPGYVPTKDFSAVMDRTYGKGGWKDTGDYRSPAREDQLRAEGAATVPAGHTSMHSRGTPDAPGAHDIVVPGDLSAAARRLPPGYKGLAEGAAGGQGAHLHVEVPSGDNPFLRYAAEPSASDENPFAKYAGGPSVSPATGGKPVAPSRPGVSPHPPTGRDTPSENPFMEFAHKVLGKGNVVTGPTTENPVQSGIRHGAEELGSRLYHPPGETKEQSGQKLIDMGWTALSGGRSVGKGGSFEGGLPRPPRSPVEGKPGGAGTIYGNEPNAATRAANALYRLPGSITADKLAMRDYLRGLPKRVLDSARNEEAYHAREEKMVKPDAKTPEHLKDIEDAVAPLHKEETDLINSLRKRGDPSVDDFLEDSGYVHRIKKGGQGDLGSSEPVRDPFAGRKSLVKRAGSQIARKFIVLEDEAGNRRFEPNAQYNKEWKAGMQVRDPLTGKEMTVKPATTKEIEASGVLDSSTGKPLQYQKHLILNTVDNVMRLRRVTRNLEVMDGLLEDMKARGVAHKEEWQFRDEDGKLITMRANQPTPEGFASLHDAPQFKGWKFDMNDPAVQELKDYLPKNEEGWLKTLDSVNSFLLRSNFFSPFVHPKNIAEFWAASRGGDWADINGYPRLAKTMGRAVQEVLTMGPKYQQLLREGSALLSGEQRAPELTQVLVDKGLDEWKKDPQASAALQSWSPFSTIAETYQAIQQASHKMMWTAGDMMMMQRVLELEERGYTPREAIRKTEEVIPNYRVPAQVWRGQGGRMVGGMFRNNRLFALGRYHYNKLAAWGRMFNKIAKGTPEERKEAFGQLVVVALLGSTVIPLINKAIKLATRNPNAELHQGGITGEPKTISGVAEGKEGLAQAVSSLLDLSPTAETVRDVSSGFKDWSGRNIIDPDATPLGKGVEGVEYGLNKFGPAQDALEAMNPSYGPARAALRQVGVDAPQKPRGSIPGHVRTQQRRQARKRENRDPIEGFIREHLQ